MATITLDYNHRNVQAQKTLDYMLSMGFFKEKTGKRNTFLDEEKENEFLYLVNEQALAKEWLNKEEDEAWKDL